jgi:hypothetical protein
MLQDRVLLDSLWPIAQRKSADQGVGGRWIKTSLAEQGVVFGRLFLKPEKERNNTWGRNPPTPL